MIACGTVKKLSKMSGIHFFNGYSKSCFAIRIHIHGVTNFVQFSHHVHVEGLLGYYSRKNITMFEGNL